ncbi:MAG: hydrolase [Cryobacterium sp.]|jgi:predicted amidohydrolase|nr:hydrolase [Cryobacterium sp.]
MTSPSTGRVARIVCAQLSPVIADLAENERLIRDAVARGIEDGADILVLPELATSGYVFASQEEARSVAITTGHQVFTEVSRLLAGRDTVVVFGFCELGERGRLFNSVAVVTGEGVRGVYRKTHLWDRETLVFTPGDTAPPVVGTPFGRIGVLICYDLEFAEMPRMLALAGADVLAVPTNWPLSEYPAGERAAEIIYAQAAARSNGVFVACCDRAGAERGQDWTEGTVIIDQYGWVLDDAGEAGTAVADVFLHLARDKTISPHNDLHGDRRSDIYPQEPPRL